MPAASTEWAEFLDALARHPELAARTVLLPGNHDINIVDRANPARLDLPFSPGKRLRQLRTLSAIAAMQGDRVHVVDADRNAWARRCIEALAPHRRCDRRASRSTAACVVLRRYAASCDDLFPMVLPPDERGRPRHSRS